MEGYNKLYKSGWAIAIFLFAFLLQGADNDPLEEIIQNMIGAVSPENLESHILVLEDAGGHRSRVTFTPGKDSAAVYIEKMFNAMPYLESVVRDTFFIGGAEEPYFDIPLFNIVATIKGTVYPDKYIVIGAHYDSSADREGTTVWRQTWNTIEAPGADDNATGVAAILEMARIMSDPEFGFSSKYTLKFVAFGAEERGVVFEGNHHGSRIYAQNARMHDEDIIGMISIDMVGYNDYFDYTAIVSNEESSWLGEELITANQNYSVELLMNEPPFPEARYSDHDNFWDMGYDAILVIEHAPPWQNGLYYVANPYYHKSSDTSDRLNMGLVRKVTQLNLAAVASLSGIVTSVGEDEVPTIADEFRLYQNYPNPFNPATVIRYKLMGSDYVTLKVYDILGREVATLVDTEQPAGVYEVEFNAGANRRFTPTSGVYFYQLKAGNYTATKKMILLE
jgi:hypothetical protein